MYFIKYNGELKIKELTIVRESSTYYYFDATIGFDTYFYKLHMNKPRYHNDEDISYYYIVCDYLDKGIVELYEYMINKAADEAVYWKDELEKLKDELFNWGSR